MAQGQPNDSRMVADRFRRIWAIAQRIADEPGYTRFQLANLFNLSERQIQADLNIIRSDMRLPLTRRSGYRFEDASGRSVAAGALDINDVLRLVGMMSALRLHDAADDQLAAKLADLAPLHLRPLAHELFLGECRESLRRVAQAALAPDGYAVRVMVRQHGTERAEIIKPELIVPYRNVWWIVGEMVSTGRCRMWRLAEVLAVEPVVVRVERRQAAS
jgi:predicted DNA-binding transcriptional regulator YafY